MSTNSIPENDDSSQPEDGDELQAELDELVSGALVTPQAQKNVNGAGDEDADTQADYWQTQLYTVGEFLQRPPKQWIVQDILGKQDYALVYGESGHGKTHVLLDFAFACATGGLFADKFAVSQPLTVVYATGEGIGGLRDRLQAVSEFYDTQDVPFYLLTDMPQLFVTETPAGVFAFVAAWQRMAEAGTVPAQIDVLIIDTLHNATQGANENSAQDAGITQRSLKLLRDKLGCAVVLSHHANKSGVSERGSTALRATMDAVLRCQKNGADKFSMACEKLKDGESWQTQAFSLVSKANSVRVFWEGDATKTTATETRESRVLAFFTDNTDTKFTADEVAQHTEDNSPMAVSNTLRKLRDAGTILAAKEKRVSQDGKTRQVWCYWTESQ